MKSLRLLLVPMRDVMMVTDEPPKVVAEVGHTPDDDSDAVEACARTREGTCNGHDSDGPLVHRHLEEEAPVVAVVDSILQQLGAEGNGGAEDASDVDTAVDDQKLPDGTGHRSTMVEVAVVGHELELP